MMKTRFILTAVGFVFSNLYWVHNAVSATDRVVAGWNFPGGTPGDPDIIDANIVGSQAGARLDTSRFVQPSFDIGGGTLASAIGFHQVYFGDTDGKKPVFPSRVFNFGFTELGSGNGGALVVRGAMGNTFSQGGLVVDRGNEITIEFSTLGLSNITLQYDIRVNSPLFEQSNPIEISVDDGAFSLVGTDDLTGNGNNYETKSFDLSAAGADDADKVVLRYTFNTEETDSFSGDPTGDGIAVDGVTIDNILIYYTELPSFWANSPADGNGWRNSGEAYPNDAGIGWIWDQAWPYVYATGFEGSNTTGHWMFVQEAGNTRQQFFAYVFNGANSYWAFVFDDGSAGISWYYNFTTQTWNQIAL